MWLAMNVMPSNTWQGTLRTYSDRLLLFDIYDMSELRMIYAIIDTIYRCGMLDRWQYRINSQVYEHDLWTIRRYYSCCEALDRIIVVTLMRLDASDVDVTRCYYCRLCSPEGATCAYVEGTVYRWALSVRSYMKQCPSTLVQYLGCSSVLGVC